MNSKDNLCDFILFGGHGDLAFRKLMPALFHLCSDEYLSDESRIITISRREMSNDEHRELVKENLIEFLPKKSFSEEKFERFKEKLQLVTIDFSTNVGYDNLQKVLNEYEDRDRVNYLSTSPDFFGGICQALSDYKLITEKTRVVLEKPLGRDLDSSRAINKKVLEYFEEDQIYRIDHYLGKDTVQNIMALRFSNRLFMHLWSSNHIDHVQVTVAESVGAEGRWGYYDEYGAMRDMIQNHLMQLLCLIAMEPPCSLDANDIRDEKVKILKTLRPITEAEIATRTVRAQYTAGSSLGESVPGYLDGDIKESNTETYAAMRIDIDNWRWNGVPFYIRSGKRMQKRNSEVVIQFKTMPHSIFEKSNKTALVDNKLVIKLQPEESIELRLMNKIPGLSENMQLQEVNLELNAPDRVKRKSDAYERLILDVIRANATLFMRLDEVEAAWKWADPVLEGWEKNLVPMKKYTAGTDGPTASIHLIAKDGRSWNDD